MKKSFIIAAFIMAVVAALSVRANAQEQPPGTKSEATPLGIESVYIPCENPADDICVAYPATVTQHPVPSHRDHEMGLYADGLPPDTDMYIVGCINTGSGGMHCTTGSDKLDAKLNSYAYGDRMVKDPTHQFAALKNPMKTDASGVLENVIVRSYTPQSTTHTFFVYYIDATGGAGPSPTTIPAQHQDKLDFDAVTPSPQPSAPQRIRVRRMNEKQDPEGRFFDAKSLEPIPTGKIALLDNQKSLVTDQELVNPQPVKQNGEFNFWVRNGAYYLDLVEKPEGYAWPLPMNVVHPNYMKAYYCDPDVKDGNNATVPLYLDQYLIFENNKLVHCDVPLDPGTNPPYRSDVATIEFSVSKPHQAQTTNLGGKVTHPLTLVTLKGGETERIVATVTADKKGFWDAAVSASQYPLRADNTPDTLVAYYQKTDLTNSTPSALVKGPVIEPVLMYLEGYAYDDAGKPLARAQAGFRQIGSEQTVYVTTTNVQGFFKIPTRYLPTFAYELVFQPTGSTAPVTVTTSRFASQNASYLKENNLNLLTENNKEYISAKDAPAQRVVNNKTVSIPAKSSVSETDNQRMENQGKLLPAIIALLVLLAIGGGIGWVIVSRNKQGKGQVIQ